MSLKISEQAALFMLALKAWAEPKKGEVRVLNNERHLWEMLTDIPDPKNIAPQIAILFRSETPRGDNERKDTAHRCDRVWWFVVVRGRGFELINDPMSGGTLQPYSDSLEEVRDTLRIILNVSDEEQVPSVGYTRMFPLPNVMPQNMANVFNDATVIELSTANDIAQVLDYDPAVQNQPDS